MLRPILALAVLLLAAAGPAAADPELRRQMRAEPESLDPHKVSGIPEAIVLDDLFEGLTVLSPTGEPVAAMARSWETSADGLVWTFHLRPDAKWSNGDALTAEDFIYSWRREIDPATASPYAAALSALAGADAIIAGKAPPATLGVAAPDPTTLKITLVQPTPWLLAALAHHTFFPVPRKAIEAAGNQWTRPGAMVGDGAYMMSGWVPHGEVTLTRNPYYYDAASVKIGTVHHVLADDAVAAVRRWEAGELDVTLVPGHELSRVQAAYPDQTHISPNMATVFLALNVRNPELADPRVRRALGMVLDREVLIQRVLKGAQIPAIGLVPPGSVPGYTPPVPAWSALSMPERIAAAKKLMIEARGAEAPPLKLTLRSTKSEQTGLVLTAVASMWKATLGVEATQDSSEWGVLEQDLHQGNYQVGAYGWSADYVDPWNYLANYRSDAAELNILRYNNPRYDALLDQSRQTADKSQRFALLAQAEAMLLDDQPLIPLDFAVAQYLVNKRLTGWNPSPVEMHPSRELGWAE